MNVLKRSPIFLAKSCISAIAVSFCFFSFAGEDLAKKRDNEVHNARLMAIQVMNMSIKKLSEDRKHDPIRYTDFLFDLVMNNALKVKKKISLKNKKLSFAYPIPGQPDDPNCFKQQNEYDEYKNHYHPFEGNKDKVNPAALKVLAYVNNQSDNTIHLCQAFFDFPKLITMPKTPGDTLMARAQVIIHEAIHLVEGHTNDPRGFAVIEKEASWYTYEQMIHGNSNFYEDGYYLLFGFNRGNFTYNGNVLYGPRYRNFVLR